MELIKENVKLIDLIRFCIERNRSRRQWNRKMDYDPGLTCRTIKIKTIIWNWVFNRDLVYGFIEHEAKSSF